MLNWNYWFIGPSSPLNCELRRSPGSSSLLVLNAWSRAWHTLMTLGTTGPFPKSSQAESLDCSWSWKSPSTRNLVSFHLLVTASLLTSSSRLGCDCPNVWTKATTSNPSYCQGSGRSSIQATPTIPFWHDLCILPRRSWPGEIFVEIRTIATHFFPPLRGYNRVHLCLGVLPV